MSLKLSIWLSGIRLKLIKLLIGKSTVIANCIFADDVHVYVVEDCYIFGNIFNGQFRADCRPPSCGEFKHKDGEQ